MSTGNSVSRQRAPARGAQSRMLRIIAGKWRGRRFRFPALEEIRPTPDRVRETLFNWLGTHVQEARCLDLFAGSGALGLEALSRGASQVTFVEQASGAVAELQARLGEWGAEGAQVIRAEALNFLRGKAHRASFGIVFLDPPFGGTLLPVAARLLEEEGWLAPHAFIYVESAAREALPGLPGGWTQARTKRAGEVGYHLYERGERGVAAR